jgi:hypothetical protein
VNLGHASTKFFHANDTIKYRRNLITMLEDDNGVNITDHHAKADLLLVSFKQRLGTSSSSPSIFYLSNLVQAHANTSALVEPFSPEEIDLVVKALPSDKSPGPDGFNTDFVKKCWHTIKQDFNFLCDVFFDGNVCLQSINGTHITLVPKMMEQSGSMILGPYHFSILLLRSLLRFWLIDCSL